MQRLVCEEQSSSPNVPAQSSAVEHGVPNDRHASQLTCGTSRHVCTGEPSTATSLTMRPNGTLHPGVARGMQTCEELAPGSTRTHAWLDAHSALDRHALQTCTERARTAPQRAVARMQVFAPQSSSERHSTQDPIGNPDVGDARQRRPVRSQKASVHDRQAPVTRSHRGDAERVQSASPRQYEHAPVIESHLGVRPPHCESDEQRMGEAASAPASYVTVPAPSR